MLHVFVNEGGALRGRRIALFEALPPETVWVDLINPTPEEVVRAETILGIRLPTREQMAEIEESSRLKLGPGVIQTTATVLVWADTDRPRIAPISFVLAGNRLATLHFVDPQPFLFFRRRVAHQGHPAVTGEAVLAALVEAVVDRTATVLRRVGIEMEAVAGRAFQHGRGRLAGAELRGEEGDPDRILRRIGHLGHLVGKAHESLVSLTRMTAFLSVGTAGTLAKDSRQWARAATLDLTGLDEYAHFLSVKANHLLDTTLGRVNAEQNEIIKIVSVVSVGLFPPTLIASIYGMNFVDMPEEQLVWGYPLALGLMVLSAVLPMVFFRVKGWL